MNHSQYKILNTATLFALGVIFLVMLIQWIAAPAYRINNHDLLAKTRAAERWILPHDMHGIIEKNKLDQFLLVDLRSVEAFSLGTLPGAVNIPLENLLDRKSLKTISKGKPVMLFSDSEPLTSIAGMMLNSKGFDKVFVLANDYAFVKQNVIDQYVPATAMSKGEKARFDYNRYFGTNPAKSAAPSKSQPTIIETEVIKAAGGC